MSQTDQTRQPGLLETLDTGDLVTLELLPGVQATGEVTQVIEAGADEHFHDTVYKIEAGGGYVLLSQTGFQAHKLQVIRKGSEYARLLEARDTLLALVDPRRSPLEWEVHRVLRATYTGFLAARGCLVERPEGDRE